MALTHPRDPPVGEDEPAEDKVYPAVAELRKQDSERAQGGRMRTAGRRAHQRKLASFEAARPACGFREARRFARADLVPRIGVLLGRRRVAKLEGLP
jgi:hypothetical protein